MVRTSGWIKLLLIILALLLLGMTGWVMKKEITWANGETAYQQSLSPDQVKTEDPVRIVIEGQADVTEQASDQSQSATDVTEEEQLAAPSLMFAGDVLLSDHVINAYDRAGGIHGVLSEGILALIDGVNLFMVNQEFPFSDRGVAAKDKQYTFRLPTTRIHILLEMGIDLVTLANNHTLDFGSDALLDNLAVLDQAGIGRVGAGVDMEQAKALVTREINGMTIGFLGASRVLPEGSWFAGANHPGILGTYDATVLLEEIEKASETCDYVVVYVHWGEERSTSPNQQQKTLGRQYIDKGADLVIGSHPHVLQGIEYYQGKPIVYSLGNFVFGSSIPSTALLQVDIEPEGPVLTLYPLTSSGGYTSLVEDGQKQQNFYKTMEQLSFGVTVDSQGRVWDASASMP